MTNQTKRNNLPWSEADLRKMRKLAADGLSSRLAAARLGRSTGAVKFKAMTEGVRFRAINQPRGVQVKLATRRRRYGMRATLARRAGS